MSSVSLTVQLHLPPLGRTVYSGCTDWVAAESPPTPIIRWSTHSSMLSDGARSYEWPAAAIAAVVYGEALNSKVGVSPAPATHSPPAEGAGWG